jgi:hypothetical protein
VSARTSSTSPSSSSSSPPCPSIRARGFWPYWLDKGDHRTVLNDLDLDKMVLLTGPNAAGE